MSSDGSSPEQNPAPPVEASGNPQPSFRINRRGFLIGGGLLAGMGLLYRNRKDQAEIDQMVEETSTATAIHSQYFVAALREVRKKHPEQEDKIREILEKVDQQGLNNLAVFKPKKDAGLQVPYTKVSVNQTGSLSNPEKAAVEDKQKVIYIVFAGIAIPPAGHPFTPWDIVYDRVINSIPMAALGKEVEVYSIGFPQSLGGKVTEAWINATQKSTDPYGVLYGEFVRGILDQNSQNCRVILHGMSLGSTVAEQAARNLTDDQKKRVQVLLDNPVADHTKWLALIKALQIPVGFAGETAARMGLDQKIQATMTTEGKFLDQVKKVLSDKGIDWQDSKEQTSLKRWAAAFDIWNMVKGSSLDTANIRSFIRRGIVDPLSFPGAGFFESLVRDAKNKLFVAKNGKSLEFAISATHFINRYRVDKWARIVSNFLPK